MIQQLPKNQAISSSRSPIAGEDFSEIYHEQLYCTGSEDLAPISLEVTASALQTWTKRTNEDSGNLVTDFSNIDNTLNRSYQ